MLIPILLTIVVLLLGSAAFLSYRLGGDRAARESGFTERQASMQELEDLYGIRITLIGVTAAGGMVDFRFRVLDADKAERLFSSHHGMPVLVPVGSETRIAVPNGSHSMNFENGKVYYLLFGNPGGVVRPGRQVQVSLGGLVLEPIPAQ